MTNQILLSVDKRKVTVAPGASVDLGVTAQNLTTLVDQVAVRVEGIDPAWIKVYPAYLPVFAQSQATARVEIRPPSDPAVAVAGTYSLRVRGSSQENPGQEGEDASELEVQLVGDYGFRLEQEQAHNGTEGSFQVKVTNSANAPLRLQFKGSDTAQALWYKFDPFQLVVPAGGTGTGLLTLKVKTQTEQQRSLPFTLTAQGEFTPNAGAAVAAPVHQVSGEFVQGAPARLIIAIQPLEIQATDRGTYSVRVGNPGAAPVSVQLTAAGDGSGLDFDFQPSQATLPAQGETSVQLVVRPKIALEGATRKVNEFRVTATPLDNQVQPVSSEAKFVQVGQPVKEPARPAFPWAILLVLFVLACMLMMFLVVFGFRILR